ncbi:hypothetical protein PL11201_670050 [Planktothrix sp. PCC 11201]|nr:hypothetical protein PL11201_670050 [Planktothrix sp. PCC 11201]
MESEPGRKRNDRTVQNPKLPTPTQDYKRIREERQIDVIKNTLVPILNS